MAEERAILALIEEVELFYLDSDSKTKKVLARVDSGATASSIDKVLAEEVGFKETNRVKLVKSASGVGRRPLILVKTKIKNKMMEEEFTLADRKHMKYPILIGQNILKKGDFLIDPNKEVIL
jgi:hypothetical protein